MEGKGKGETGGEGREKENGREERGRESGGGCIMAVGRWTPLKLCPPSHQILATPLTESANADMHTKFSNKNK